MTQIPGLFNSLAGFRVDMSTSLPSGSAPVTYMNRIPTSRAEAEKIKVTSEGGGSKTQEAISVNLTLKPWNNKDYHKRVFKGQQLFLQRSGTNMFHKPIVMNILQTNGFLREGYLTAKRIWANRELIVGNNVLTGEEYDLLMSTPTSSWEDFDFFTAMLRDSQKKDYHCIKYLYEAGMRERLTPFGFHRNPTNDLEFIEVSASVYGTCEYVENIWTNNIYSGMKVGYVFKRIFDPHLNEYTHFAFDPRPWAKGVVPTPEQSQYVDITGHICDGYVFQIGTVDERSITHIIEQDIVEESIGLIPTSRERFMVSGEPGCLRITLCPRVEYPIHWYH